MPRIGMPKLKIDLSALGESSKYTLLGPPERIIATGFLLLITDIGVFQKILHNKLYILSLF